jgi:nucleotide-binding universal stress UspA family protein
MYRKILVPLDGSELAESALPFALSLAERSEGEVHLVQVAATLQPFALFEETEVEGSGWLEEARARSGEYLKEVQARIQEAGGSATVHTRVLSGRPVPAIHGFILKEGIDQVVMTTHGRGRLQRMWLGSVADGVLRSVPAPVFLWRGSEEGKVDLKTRPTLGRILVALDGSDMARAMVPWAEELARLLGARLFLVGVLPTEVRFGSPYIPHAAAEEASRGARRLWLETHLERVAQEIRSRGMDVEHALVAGPDAHVGILMERERTGADVVALSTHGRGPGTRALLGSVADKVIRGSEGHVLVHRDAEEA